MKRNARREWPNGGPRLITDPAREERRAFSRLLRRPFYVISDTHFFHRNIVGYAGRPADHDSIMLERWRATVARGDVVFHLGDVFHWRGAGLQRFSAEIAPKLTGEKYLLLGSHDKHSIDYAGLGFEVIRPFAFEYLGYEISFSHWPSSASGYAMRRALPSPRDQGPRTSAEQSDDAAHVTRPQADTHGTR